MQRRHLDTQMMLAQNRREKASRTFVAWFIVASIIASLTIWGLMLATR